MMVRLHLVTPTRLRLEVLARLNNNGISEIPFQGCAVKAVLVWHRLAAEYFALYLMDRRHHLRTIAFQSRLAAMNKCLARVGLQRRCFGERRFLPPGRPIAERV